MANVLKGWCSAHDAFTSYVTRGQGKLKLRHRFRRSRQLGFSRLLLDHCPEKHNSKLYLNFRPWQNGARSLQMAGMSAKHDGQEASANSLEPSKADYEKDHSMAFRRTVYGQEEWTKHRSSTRHSRHILTVLSSRVIRSLGPPVLSLTIIATAVAAFNEAVLNNFLPPGAPLLQVSSLPLQLTAPALALLLVFRTNASYARFDEARKAWGSNVNRCRDISRQALTWIRNPADLEKRDQLLRYCIALPFSLKDHLTSNGGLKEELTRVLLHNELELLLEFPHQPNYILQTMSEIIHACKLSDMERALLDKNLTQFHDNLGACERILKTPIPVSYTRLTSRFLVIWHISLPFALWSECGWLVIPATFLSAGALFCIEEVGVLIEEPLSMLALNSICAAIQRDIRGLAQAHSDNLRMFPLDGKDEGVKMFTVNGVRKQGDELDH